MNALFIQNSLRVQSRTNLLRGRHKTVRIPTIIVKSVKRVCERIVFANHHPDVRNVTRSEKHQLIIRPSGKAGAIMDCFINERSISDAFNVLSSPAAQRFAGERVRERGKEKSLIYRSLLNWCQFSKQTPKQLVFVRRYVDLGSI